MIFYLMTTPPSCWSASTLLPSLLPSYTSSPSNGVAVTNSALPAYTELTNVVIPEDVDHCCHHTHSSSDQELDDSLKDVFVQYIIPTLCKMFNLHLAKRNASNRPCRVRPGNIQSWCSSVLQRRLSPLLNE